jgi:DNA-binding Lrp family transcriptional regulator
MSTKIQVEWRRRQVFELSSKGHSQVEIAKTLQISESTISRDLDYLKQQSKKNIRRYVDERLPEEYEKCLVGLTAILREAWSTSQQAEDRREKIQAFSLAKECYSMKLDLLTNATVVDDAIKFVSDRSKEKMKSATSTNKDDKYEDQLEEKQEKEPGETASTTGTTLNQVF